MEQQATNFTSLPNHPWLATLIWFFSLFGFFDALIPFRPTNIWSELKVTKYFQSFMQGNNSPESCPPKNVTIDLTTFTCFPRLPLELRQAIWTFASYNPRAIEIHLTKDDDIYHHSNFAILHNTPPAITQVNCESRNIALNYYRFESVEPGQQPTMINFDADIIFLAGHRSKLTDTNESRECWHEYWGLTGVLRKIRRLAVLTRTISSDQRANIDFFAHGERLSTNHNDSLGILAQQFGNLGTGLRELFLVDNQRAQNSRAVRNLISLKPNDIIQLFQGGLERNKRVVRVDEWVEAKKTSLKVVLAKMKKDLVEKAKKENVPVEDLRWIDNFTPEIKVMQLRHNYSEGVEGRAPASKKDEDLPTRPVRLGKLQKVGDVWDIVRC